MGKINSVLARLNLWMGAALLLAFFVFGYLILSRLNMRFDLTKDKIFTLSSKTLEILKDLGEEPVRVLAFFKEDQGGKEELEDFLKIYHYVNSNFQYEFLDPDRHLRESKLYKVDEYGTIIIERKDRRERVKEITEEAITNALLKLTETRQKTVFFVKGHGEKEIESTQGDGYSNFRAKLESENFLVKEMALSREAVPEDADVLIVPGPKSDFLPEEVQALKQFAEKGGSVILLLDPQDSPLENFEKWLKEYGVVPGRDIVIDKLSRVFGADYLIPVVMKYGEHKITEGFNVASFLPSARSVVMEKELPAGIKVTELAFTSQGSWAENNWEQLEKGEVSFDEGEKAGPVSLAAAIEKEGSKMRVVVFGDSNFADNKHFYLSGNKDLILNAVAWAAGEEKLVTIRSRERESTPLVLSVEQQRILFAIPVFVLPLASFGAGLAVLLFRRRYS